MKDLLETKYGFEINEYVMDEDEPPTLETYSVVYTIDEISSLTFTKIVSRKKMLPLLDLLDAYCVKGTFFASTRQIERFPRAVSELLKRGHDIQCNPFFNQKISTLNNKEIDDLLTENVQLLKKVKGKQPTYMRVSQSQPDKHIVLKASELGIKGLIHHSYRLRGLNSTDEKSINVTVSRAMARGGILLMNPEHYLALPYLMQAMEDVNFTFISLEELIARDLKRRPFQEIPGSDTIRINKDMKSTKPFIHQIEQTRKKQVALTFDDWANEVVIRKVLDILDKYQIRATFYLKTQRLHENPNLARVLIERGHEVANHTHSHFDSTKVTPSILQGDIYQAHQIITEAIQEQPKLYFRPPFGRFNMKVAKAVTAMGFEVIAHYNIASFDWNMELSEEDIVERITSRLKPGSVIVMHILNNIHTPSVLPKVIEAVHNAGYEFVLTSDWIEAPKQSKMKMNIQKLKTHFRLMRSR